MTFTFRPCQQELVNTTTIRINTIKSFLLSAAALLIAAPVGAWEWTGGCGVTKASVTSCTFIKGDAALDGITGMNYTYVLPSGDRFQRFSPDGEGGICSGNGLMRKNEGAWFKVNTSCDGGYIIHSLPSGHSMLIEIYATP
ncbi:hypothetical protein FQK07_14880 [Synechococcus sp. BSF8S]|uniref:hypothetical protein n=1 Tax=Synechococcales TaxID=1890424 RepID=UPI0016255687|nr:MULTISPECIES: hypothetical protein [unclassified Synechococcus]MBC1262508.1 hypothetical protein [Synechococcus sp. BSF8S]MBC1263669.1 hypothetical protein [Synechococcus sp. BSA11S]